MKIPSEMFVSYSNCFLLRLSAIFFDPLDSKGRTESTRGHLYLTVFRFRIRYFFVREASEERISKKSRTMPKLAL